MTTVAAVSLGRSSSVLDFGRRRQVSQSDLNETGEIISGADHLALRASLAYYGRLSKLQEGHDVNPHNHPRREVTWRISKLVIDPDKTNVLGVWDIMMFLCLIFVAIAMPVEVAMLEVRLDGLFVVNRVLDLLFIIDMVLQFFLMYPVRTRYLSYLEDRHEVIVRRYLSTWFAVDFVSILPFDIIGLASDHATLSKFKAMKVLRLLRLLKLTRTLKASRMVRRLEVQLSWSYQRMSLMKFFLMLVMVAHWQACAWCTTLRMVDKSMPRWVDSIQPPQEESQPQTRIEDSPGKLYVVSLYFAMYTMTSVGYGDISPSNVVERGLCVVFLLVSGVAWAYIIGQVTSIVGKMGLLDKRYRDMLDEVNYMLWDRGVPPDLKKRLRTFFLATKDVDRYGQQRSLQVQMSVGLQGQVAMMTHAIWLDKIEFLQEFLQNAKIRTAVKEAKMNREVHFNRVPPFILEISLALRFKMYAREEYFGKPNVLYILSTGLVMHQNALVLRQGQVWGEDFVLPNSTLLTPFVVLCLCYVEVLMLERDAFQFIIDKHQREYPGLAKAVRRHVVRLTARRALIAEARKLKAKRTGTSELELMRSGPVAVYSAPQVFYEEQDVPLQNTQLKCLWDDISNLKEVQRQNAEMMQLLAKHEARLVERLKGRAAAVPPPVPPRQFDPPPLPPCLPRESSTLSLG